MNLESRAIATRGLMAFDNSNLSNNLGIFSVAKSTVISTVKKYSNSQSFESKVRTGRKSNISEREFRYIKDQIKNKPEITSNELSIISGEVRQKMIPASTIRNILLKRGIRSYSARKTQFLTKSMREKRLSWCKRHVNFSQDYWNRVLFSDETTIEINPCSIINKVRRFSFENPYQKKFIQQKVKFPQKLCSGAVLDILAKQT